MLLHKKIRFLRLNKGWSQETMADKLNMSPNGYGSIERGETNVQISRILQIAKLFDVNASDLLQEVEGNNIFNSMGSHNTEIQNNNNSRCYFGASESNYGQSECQSERHQIESNIEKQMVMLDSKNNEIFLLKQINELLTSTKLAPHRILHSRGAAAARTLVQRRKEEQQLKSDLASC
ncbi:MAG: hypothetical protein RLZZ384_847 [Pseudomonadota bacterium]|jgi:transcriptional regulator with XRE-family HTH domain